METRNLTIVFDAGEYRVAQYGQWDGYPEGAGIKILRFLRDEMYEFLFRTRLSRFNFVAENDDIKKRIDKAFENGIGSYCFPEFSRDTGCDILPIIQNDMATTHYLGNRIDFAADSVFCEWAYVVDFDHRTFEVFKGFNKTPLEENERFYFLNDKIDPDACLSGTKYYQVKLAATFDLDNLPEDKEFLDEFKDDDEEANECEE